MLQNVLATKLASRADSAAIKSRKQGPNPLALAFSQAQFCWSGYNVITLLVSVISTLEHTSRI
jgi:hypothetical protein